MRERKAPAGILCALVTPFGTGGAPDLTALGELVDFQAERGTDALFLLGTTGKGMALESAERPGWPSLRWSVQPHASPS